MRSKQIFKPIKNCNSAQNLSKSKVVKSLETVSLFSESSKLTYLFILAQIAVASCSQEFLHLEYVYYPPTIVCFKQSLMLWLRFTSMYLNMLRISYSFIHKGSLQTEKESISLLIKLLFVCLSLTLFPYKMPIIEELKDLFTLTPFLPLILSKDVVIAVQYSKYKKFTQ